MRYLAFFMIIFLGCKVRETGYPASGYIEILDEKALTLLDPKERPEIIASGFAWTEGPLWLEEKQLLLFSDIPNNAIHAFGDGTTSLYLKPSGYTGTEERGGEKGSNALLLDPKGNLVLMQHGDRRVARMESRLETPDSNFSTVIADFQGKKLNSPNDGVYDSKGNLYFTDPPYGLEKGAADPGKELDLQGVYLYTASGELFLLDTMSRPNGIALSPDERQLFLANSDPKKAVWFKYNLDPDGKMAGERTIFYDCTDMVGQTGHQGLPDGMKMHSSGYLFASGPAGIWIFDPSGIPVAKIHTGEKTSNCAFSADEKTLFMTADKHVMRISLK
jgi:gluconolactonase